MTIDADEIVVSAGRPEPKHEGKAFAEFEKELLEVGHQGVFEIGFAEVGRLGQAGELQDAGIFDEVFGAVDLVTVLGQGVSTCCVAGQGEAFVSATSCGTLRADAASKVVSCGGSLLHGSGLLQQSDAVGSMEKLR